MQLTPGCFHFSKFSIHQIQALVKLVVDLLVLVTAYNVVDMESNCVLLLSYYPIRYTWIVRIKNKFLCFEFSSKLLVPQYGRDEHPVDGSKYDNVQNFLAVFVYHESAVDFRSDANKHID